MADKVPSFEGYVPSSEKSSRSKKANRKTGTKHEIMLQHTLWHMGLCYRKNIKDLPGKPDIVFRSLKIAIFCDGDFWHGRNWGLLKAKLQKGSNSSYWIAKIESNIKRDIRNNLLLEKNGWYVIRVWEGDIMENTDRIANKIKDIVIQRKTNKRGIVIDQTTKA